jgi:hypothetical protein
LRCLISQRRTDRRIRRGKKGLENKPADTLCILSHKTSTV